METVIAVPAIGGLLALTIPIYALKELLEKRMEFNMKKHLDRRHVCRVHFGSLDTPITPTKGNKTRSRYSSSCESNKTLPPAYNDLFHPPPPYEGKDVSI